MNTRKKGLSITLIMTLCVLGGFGVILLMNVAALLGIVPSRYISPNDVRGVAIMHHELLYTLNFEQQNAIIDIFNNAIPVGKELVATRSVQPAKPVEIQKIIIYRFNAPDIEAIPVAYVSKAQSAMSIQKKEHTNLVFSVPEWNKNGLLEEASSDDMQTILLNTYDH